jgi:hypothetical protein
MMIFSPTQLKLGLFSLLLLLPFSVWSGNLQVTVTQLNVTAHPGAPDLICQQNKSKQKVIKKPQSIQHEALNEIPDEEEVRDEIGKFAEEASLSRLPSQAESGILGHARPGEPYRVAVWGDSHLAAAFFTNELEQLLHLPPQKIVTGFIPANMNRGGVRLPLRKTCVSANWRYETAYAHASAAHAPGPGLVNLYTSEANSSLSWDLRSPAGVAEKRQVRILYQQTTQPQTVAISIDGAEEVLTTLVGSPGPAALELVADAPLSVARLRLVEGEFRLHGLSFPEATAALQMDVFGYPGATVAGWKEANQDYLSAWFSEQNYDLVMLEFGTNEGNVKSLDAHAYQDTLRKSLSNMRTLFPDSACILIAPGDRGVLVRRKGKRIVKQLARKQHNTRQRSQMIAAPGNKATPGDLLRFTRIHTEINQIQKKVAAEYRCTAWSMMDAMGGAGSAYRWARHSPPWMARDLIHFTVPGYLKLADLFAKDLGWNANELLTPELSGIALRTK